MDAIGDHSAHPRWSHPAPAAGDETNIRFCGRNLIGGRAHLWWSPLLSRARAAGGAVRGQAATTLAASSAANAGSLAARSSSCRLRRVLEWPNVAPAHCSEVDAEFDMEQLSGGVSGEAGHPHMLPARSCLRNSSPGGYPHSRQRRSRRTGAHQAGEGLHAGAPLEGPVGAGGGGAAAGGGAPSGCRPPSGAPGAARRAPDGSRTSWRPGGGSCR